MKLNIYLLLFLGPVVFSCSNSKSTGQKINDHERVYSNTSDSLKSYLVLTYVQELVLSDSTLKDYTQLNYKTFKKKYKLNFSEMDQAIQTVRLTCDIAHALEAIEDNIKKAESVNFDSINAPDTTNYTFQKSMLFDTNSPSLEDSVLFKVLMEAYDVEIDTL